VQIKILKSDFANYIYKDKNTNFDNLEVKWPPQKVEPAEFEEIRKAIADRL